MNACSAIGRRRRGILYENEKLGHLRRGLFYNDDENEDSDDNISYSLGQNKR